MYFHTDQAVQVERFDKPSLSELLIKIKEVYKFKPKIQMFDQKISQHQIDIMTLKQKVETDYVQKPLLKFRIEQLHEVVTKEINEKFDKLNISLGKTTTDSINSEKLYDILRTYVTKDKFDELNMRFSQFEAFDQSSGAGVSSYNQIFMDKINK